MPLETFVVIAANDAIAGGFLETVKTLVYTDGKGFGRVLLRQVFAEGRWECRKRGGDVSNGNPARFYCRCIMLSWYVLRFAFFFLL